MREWNYENDQWTKLPFHMRHLPLFTRHFDLTSTILRFIWYLFLKYVFFRFYLRLKVVGSFKEARKNHPRLILICNHTSHLDAVSIATSIPFLYWLDLYIAAAKDYFFAGFSMTFFAKHCIGAIPIDRKDKRGEAVKLCTNLLMKLNRIWLVMFPEGTRSKDGLIHPFKKGIAVFSERTKTPVFFLYLEGGYDLWPKDAGFAKPGKLTMHVGPIHPPSPIEEIYASYKAWVKTFKSDAFADDLPTGDPTIISPDR